MKHLFLAFIVVLLSSCQKKTPEQDSDTAKPNKEDVKIPSEIVDPPPRKLNNYEDPESIKSMNELVGYDLYGVDVFGSAKGKTYIEVYREFGIDKAVVKMVNSRGDDFFVSYNAFLKIDPHFDKINGCLEGVIDNVKTYKDIADNALLNSKFKELRSEIISLLKRVKELPDGERENKVKYRILKACFNGTYAIKGFVGMNRDLNLVIEIIEKNQMKPL